MDAADWATLKEWFGAALDASPAQLQEIFENAERHSPRLTAELRALLREHDSQELRTMAVMEQSRTSVEAHPPEGPAGGELGPYRLLRELGRGGTGIVFLAERRDDEFHRPVALKVLRYVAWDRRSQELLTLERRVLSQLQHPNIASLLDWGESAEGAPWLATEYVEGEAIDDYCRARALDVPGVLEVFAQACRAVQYAHWRLVVHRDLKPANILVTATGLVKLLDFGISKPLAEASVTKTTERRFTPAYASPEQIKGEAVTAATDVYSLGLILYELLAGFLPNATGSLEDMVRRTEDRKLPPPSAAPGLPWSRVRAMRGDLDRIVLHALERDPERRYPSVEQLLADVERYRDGFPIEAQRASPVYRARKFVGRHAVPVALAALAVVALVTGAGVAIWNARVARQEQQVAERRFRDLQSLAHSVMFDLHDSIRRVPGSVEARRLLITTAVKYLDGLSAENVTDDSLQMEMAAGYIRMAYVQGGTASINIGDTPAAHKSYRTALRILDDQWRRRAGEDQQIGVLRAGAAYNLSMMINDPHEAARFATPYADDADMWSRQNPIAGPIQASYLLHSAIGRIHRRAGSLDESIRHFDIAADAQRRILPTTFTDNEPRPMFAVAVARGQAIYDSALTLYARTETLLDMGRPQEALESLDESRRKVDEGVRMNPDGKPGPAERLTLVRHRGMRAMILLQLGRQREALEEARAELAGAEADNEAGNATAQRQVALAHGHVAKVLCATRDVRGCLGHYRDASEALDTIAKLDPGFTYNSLVLSAVLNDYADALLLDRQPQAADPLFRRALDTSDRALAEAPSWVELTRERDRARAGLARSGE